MIRSLRLLGYAFPPLLLLGFLGAVGIWLGQQPTDAPRHWTASEAEVLAAWARAQWADDPSAPAPELPPAATAGTSLFTLYLPHQPDVRRVSPGDPTALAQTLERLNGYVRDEATLKWEIQRAPEREVPAPLRAFLPSFLDLGVEALRVHDDRTDRTHWIFPSAFWEHDVRVSALRSGSLAPALSVGDGGTVSRFPTTGLILERHTDRAWRVRRNQPVQEPPLTRARVLAAIQAGGDYLIRHQAASGRFTYVYNPITDTAEGGYNLLRHAGTAFALFQVYGLTKAPRYRRAGDRALAWLEGFTEDDGTYRYVQSGERVKLGGAALALLALTERERHVQDGRDRSKMTRLAAFIQGQMDADGALRSYYAPDPGKPAPDRVSIYYPGEATLALVRLARITGDTRWRDTAIQAADYLMNRGKLAGVHYLVFPDAWLLYALSELHTLTGESRFLAYGQRIGAEMLAAQYRDPNDPFYTGGILDAVAPGSTPAAARAEGLGALCRALEKADAKPSTLARYRAGQRRFNAFQLRHQADAYNSFAFADPEMAHGGFMASVVDPRMRIDYTQHNLSALLYALDALPGEGS
jgi:hypothetical protein